MITLDTLKDSVYSLHLTIEQDEQILEIIETAYRLGCENGYVECSVEGFNDALQKIKRKLR